jgi:hypothetical protein
MTTTNRKEQTRQIQSISELLRKTNEPQEQKRVHTQTALEKAQIQQDAIRASSKRIVRGNPTNSYLRSNISS